MLADAVARLSGQPQAKKKVQCEMKVGIPAYLPETYVPDENERLFFYKRIASAQSADELQDSMEDMADRCGPPPEEATNLFDITGLKLLVQAIGVKSFTYNQSGIVLALDESSPYIGQALVDLVQRPKAAWKLTPQVELVRSISPTEWHIGLPTAWSIIRKLQSFLARYQQ